jgi:ribonuclease HIII
MCSTVGQMTLVMSTLYSMLSAALEQSHNQLMQYSCHYPLYAVLIYNSGAVTSAAQQALEMATFVLRLM